MAGADRSFKIVFDIEANAKNMEKAMADMRSGFSKLNLSDGFNKELNKTFTQLEQELTKLRGLTSKDTFNSSELNTVIKSFERLTNLYNTLKVKHSQIKGMSLDKLIPPNALKDLKSFQSLLQKLDNLSFNNLQEEINKVSQKLAEAKTKQDELKKAMQNAPAVAAAKQQRADDTFKQFEDQKKRAEELKKVWDDLAKVQGKKRNEDAIKQAAENYSSATKEAERLSKAYNKAAAAASAANEAVTTSKEAYNAQTTKVKELQIELNGLKDGSGNLEVIKQEIAQLAGISIDKLPNDIQQLKVLLEDLAKQKLDGTTQELKNIETAGKNADRSIEQLNDELRKGKSTGDAYTERAREIDQLANRVKYFFSLTNAVLLFRRAIKSAINTVKELDEVMTQAAVVTKFTVGDMWKQLPQYAQRANELGVTIKGVYEASTLYYQQGLETNQVIGVANETLKMAKIAGLDYATATDYMTSALRGFNMEVNELSAQKVNDIYSQLAAHTASNVEEISTAMSKTAPLAHNAGMEIETTAALLAQMIERTREAPETLGTAMKTVIARFQELKKDPALIEPVEGEVIDANKVETALRTIGVSLRDTSGQFRELDDVFLEISEKWDTLSTNTQRYIATIAAGSRQQSRFIAMMADYKRTMELVGLANTAAGASEEQFEKTLDSLESKLNQLKTAWEQFTMGLANNQVIKGVIDLITGFINIINKLTNSLSLGNSFLKSFWDVGALILGISIGKKIFIGFFNWLLKDSVLRGTEAGKAYSTAFNAGLGKGLAGIIKNFSNYRKLLFSTNTLTRQTAALNLKLAGAASTAAGAQSGLNAALIACPLGWYALAAAAVVAILALWVKYEKEISLEGRMKTAAEETKAAKEAAEKAKDAYDDLLADRDEYNSLQEKLENVTYGTLEWKEALVEANNQVLKLIELYPKLAAALEKGNFGQLTISESGWEDYIEEQNQEVMGAQSVTLAKQLQENRLKIEKINSNYDQQIEDFLSGKKYSAMSSMTIDETTKKLLEKAVKEGITSNFSDYIKENNPEAFAGRTAKDFAIGKDLGLKEGYEFNVDNIENTGLAIIKYNEALEEQETQIQKTTRAVISTFLSPEIADELGDSTKGVAEAIGESFEKKFEGINTDKLIADHPIFGKNNGIFLFDGQKEIFEKIGQEYDKNFKSTKVGPKRALIELYAKMKDTTFEDIQALGMTRKELAEAIQKEYGTKLVKDFQVNSKKFVEGLDKIKETSEEDRKALEVALTDGLSFKGDIDFSEAGLSAEELWEKYEPILSLLYDNEEAFSKAYLQEIVEAQKARYESLTDLVSKGIDIKDLGTGMDNGMLQGLVKHLLEVFVASGSDEAEKIGQKIQGIFNKLNELDPKKAEEFMSAFLGLDWKDVESVNSLSDKLDELGITAEELGVNSIDDLEQEIKDLADASDSVDLEKLTKQIRSLGQIAYDIKSGNQKNEFSEEQMNELVTEGAAKASDFYWDFSTKSYKFMGDLEDLGEAAAQSSAALIEQKKAANDEEIARANLAKILSNTYEDNDALLKAAAKTGKFGINEEALSKATTQQRETWAKEIRSKEYDIPALLDKKQALDFDMTVSQLQIEYGNNGKGLAEEVNKAVTGELIASYNSHQFGNIDLDNRGRINWTQDNLNKYQSELSSWGFDTKDFKEEDYSTVLGSSDEFSGQEIAFSPILQTADGPILLGRDTVNNYIKSLIAKAEEDGNGWTDEELFKLDAEGLEIEGTQIKGLIADIGETAEKTGSEMHFIGDAIEKLKDYGSIKDELNNPANYQYIKNLAEAAGIAKETIKDLTASELFEMTVTYQNATAHGIDTKELQEYADQLQKANKNLTKLQATQVALGNTRLNKGIKSLIDSYEDWTKVLDQTGGKLKNLTSEEAKVVQELGSSLTTMFDLTEEQANDLIENHYELIKQVAEGSKEALAQLQEEAAKEVVLDIKTELHDEEAIAAIDNFAQFLDNYDLPELEPGMDLTNAWAGYDEFIRICSNMLTSGATTVEGLKAIFTNLGFQGTIEWGEPKSGSIITPYVRNIEKGSGNMPNLFPDEIQELKMQYYQPIFRFKSIGSGGGGVSPTITPASPSGGSGGGGSSSEDKTWENPYDWLYNLTQKINAELRTREKLERRYNRLLKTHLGSGKDLKNITDQEIESLKKRREYEVEMIKLRKQELKEYLAANAALAKYAQIDWELEVVRIDWNKINTVTDTEEGEAIEEYISKLEELINYIKEAEDAIEDIDDDLIDIKERGRDQYQDLEDRVLDALISEQQKLIDEQERIYDAINDAASDLMDAISKNIEKIRQDRQNEETETSLAEKERRLAYLRQDTTGSNALEIKKLEQDLDKEKQNYTDTLIDQGLNDLKEQNDYAAEQREKQIELMQSTLDWQQQTGYWVDEATRIVQEGLGPDGVMSKNTRMYQLLYEQEGVITNSNASRDRWDDDLADSIAQAFVWLKGALADKGVGNEAKQSDTPEQIKNKMIDNSYRWWTTGSKSEQNSLSNNQEKLAQAYRDKTGNNIYSSNGKWYNQDDTQFYSLDKTQIANSIVDQMKENEDTLSGEELQSQNKFLADKLKLLFDNKKSITQDSSGVWWIDGEELYRKRFKHGGLANFTGPAWLDGTKSKPEMVLNAKDTENFLQLKDILSNLRMSFSGSKGALGGDWYFDIDINVGEIANDYDVDQLTERVKQSIYTESTYRNVNAINFLK